MRDEHQQLEVVVAEITLENRVFERILTASGEEDGT